MTSIKWDDNYNVGVEIIDEQHKHFVGLINKLYKSLDSDNTEKVSEIIKDVVAYADFHFKTEEDYFEKFHYEDAAEHKAAHEELRAKVKSFVDRHDDPKTLGFDLLYFLEKWLLFHFKGKDKKYVASFKQHGLS